MITPARYYMLVASRFAGRALPVLLLALWGCVPAARLPERPRLACPAPEVVCLPGSFDRVTIDTLRVARGSYLTIEKVRGLDSPVDEFGIAFAPRIMPTIDGMATTRSTARDGTRRDYLIQTQLPRQAEAIVGGIAAMHEGDKGSMGRGVLSAGEDTIYLAARPAENVAGDYDLFSARIANPRMPRAGGGLDSRRTNIQDAVASMLTITSSRRSDLSSILAWDAQPALSPDGNSLYFASNRAGSIGGTDIYVSRRSPEGEWSAPQDLGSGVNTPCDELSPWVSSDGKWLYFSSSGHATVGGYDLFRAPILGTEVGGAENLGRPVNTPADELFPSAPPGSSPDTLLYYSSNQSGSKGFDMYVLHPVTTGGVSATPEVAEKTTLTGTVRNTKGEPVEHAIVTIAEHDPPGSEDSTSTTPSGRYTFPVERGKSYDITAGSSSTLYTHEGVDIPRHGTGPVVRDLTLPDTITFRVNFPFNNATDPYQFTLDEQGLPSGAPWTEVLDRTAEFLKQFADPGDGFVVVGHTDPIGTEAFNLDLGRRRAEFIRRELIRRGVSPGLLSVRSEGKGRPLPMHSNESDELYRARLRRVELFRK